MQTNRRFPIGAVAVRGQWTVTRLLSDMAERLKWGLLNTQSNIYIYVLQNSNLMFFVYYLNFHSHKIRASVQAMNYIYYADKRINLAA